MHILNFEKRFWITRSAILSLFVWAGILVGNPSWQTDNPVESDHLPGQEFPSDTTDLLPKNPAVPMSGFVDSQMNTGSPEIGDLYLGHITPHCTR